jgi:hypothetical protein
MNGVFFIAGAALSKLSEPMKNTLNVPLIFSRVWARCAHPSFSTRVEEHQGEEKNNYAEAERRRKETRGTK